MHMALFKWHTLLDIQMTDLEKSRPGHACGLTFGQGNAHHATVVLGRCGIRQDNLPIYDQSQILKISCVAGEGSDSIKVSLSMIKSQIIKSSCPAGEGSNRRLACHCLTLRHGLHGAEPTGLAASAGVLADHPAGGMLLLFSIV